ncbi:hypothetical protein [Pelagimonas varians]|uniref:Glutathionyl-hydroquinone reductase YqjG n=1 Tax=Pelagimonas varians TaxID=696760 RepID=A0A238L4J6_9RHOB|nr:glutathione S-transferase-like protein [Pelagimonas varians]SMX49246.1 Glutathionyl-hydroquinone reductase YqjG [Pelagimonas varians]
MRNPSAFRNWVTADGSAGPSGVSGLKAEARRFHLYVSLACPWAHRTLVFRALKGVEDMIDISFAHWFIGPDGWTFTPGDGSTPGPINNATFLHQVNTAAKPDFTGQVTVPVLWDKQQGAIVSNESADVIGMFNAAFDDIGAAPEGYCPEGEREEIDALNARIFDTVNNGVYKAGLRRRKLSMKTHLIRFMSDTSNAISVASPTILTSRDISAICISIHASRRLSTSPTSKTTTTAAITR